MDEIERLAIDLAANQPNASIAIVADRLGCMTYSEFSRLKVLIRDIDPTIKLTLRAAAYGQQERSLIPS